MDLDAAYSAVDSTLVEGEQCDPNSTGLDDAAKAMIEQAVNHANRLSHHYVGTEHLLMALPDAHDSSVARMLSGFGVSHQTVRALLELQKERLAARTSRVRPET